MFNKDLIKEFEKEISRLNKENEALGKECRNLKEELRREKSENSIRLREAISLKDIEFKQEIQKLKQEIQDEVIEEKSRLNKEFYERMTEELATLHKEGNSQTKFVQKLALQMWGGKMNLIKDESEEVND